MQIAGPVVARDRRAGRPGAGDRRHRIGVIDSDVGIVEHGHILEQPRAKRRGVDPLRVGPAVERELGRGAGRLPENHENRFHPQRAVGDVRRRQADRDDEVRALRAVGNHRPVRQPERRG